MKKTISIGIVLTLVLTVVSGIIAFPGIAGTESEPNSYPLYAGQDELVGHVEVWNDEDNIYVDYEITEEDWEITETHLYVGRTDPADLTSAPGQFPYSGQISYVIPLDDICEWELETNNKGKKTGKWVPIEGTCGGSFSDVYIAAHAVVMDISCYNTGVVYGIERNNGNVWGVDVLAGTSWLEFTIPNPPGGNSASPNGLAYNPINGFFYYTDYTLGTTPDTLYFWDGTSQTTAGQVASGTVACGDISDGKYYYIPSNTDDLYEITFNPDGTIATDTKLGDISDNAHGWGFYGDIAVKDGVVYGWGHDSHGYEYFMYELESESFFLTKPTYQSSLQLAFGSNGELYGHRSGGTGAFYEIDKTNGDVTLISEPRVLFTDCASGEICVPTTETAWAAIDETTNDDGEHGIQFPSNNWATYFEYTIHNWVLVDTIEVPAAQTAPTSTNIDLENGELYKFVASGKCNWRVPPSPNGYLADASYWLRHDSLYDGWRDQYSLAMWDGGFANIPWVNPDTGLVEYSSAHIYNYEYTATTDGPVQFIFTDDQYSDNSGYLTLEIYQWI